MRRLVVSTCAMLLALGGCATSIRREAPAAAEEVLQAYRQAVWAELLPELDKVSTEDILDTAGTLALRHVAPYTELLAAKGEQVLAGLPALKPIDRSQYEIMHAEKTASADLIRELTASLGAPGSNLLLARDWNPVAVAQTARALVMQRALGPEWYAKRSLVDALAPPTTELLTPDPARPTIAFLSGDELLLVSLQRTSRRIYQPEKIEWLKRRKE